MTYINPIGLFGWLFYEVHFESHDIPMLGKSPMKWRQRPDMTIAVDWDVKHQFKQTNKQTKFSLMIIYSEWLLPVDWQQRFYVKMAAAS